VSAKLGSMDHAAKLAKGELLERRYSYLTAAVGGEIARYGESNWRTDRDTAEAIRMPNGRVPHRESVARVRRQLRDEGIISSQRVFVGGKLPTQAKYRTSSRGTTIKSFNWRAVDTKNPFSRRERRVARQVQAIELRKAGQLQKPPRDRPRHVAVVPTVQPPVPIDPEFARYRDEILEHQERNARSVRPRAEYVDGHARAPERPPPE
jgi:hypothetical protein